MDRQRFSTLAALLGLGIAGGMSGMRRPETQREQRTVDDVEERQRAAEAKRQRRRERNLRQRP